MANTSADKRRYLITGATGFVGANLLRRLVELGKEVHILVRKSADTWRINDIISRVAVHTADLNDFQGLKAVVTAVRPEIIYHCAVHGGYSFQQDPFAIAQTNFTGTLNLLQALADVKFHCFVNTGSSGEYGTKNHPMGENDLLEPSTVYGVTKAAATLLCQAAGRQKKLPVISLRLFSPYGPYEEPSRLVPAVIGKCLHNQDIPLSTGKETRDFIHIDDVIDCYLQVIDRGLPPGEIVNVCSGSQHTVSEIVCQAISITGSQSKPLYGALPPREFDARFWVGDNSKAARLISWRPKTTIAEGLAKTIAWHRSFYRC